MKNENNIKDLKALSKNWTAEQWERYLQSIEGSCKEVLIHPEYFDKRAQTESISNFFKDLPLHEEKFQPSPLIKKLLNQLSKNQKKVIINLFWEGLTQEQIAESMGCKGSTVSILKSRALKKIKNIIPPELQEFFKRGCTDNT